MEKSPQTQPSVETKRKKKEKTNTVLEYRTPYLKRKLQRPSAFLCGRALLTVGRRHKEKGCTRGCTWVIGQTGVIKCMYQHKFFDPVCPITHLHPRVRSVVGTTKCQSVVRLTNGTTWYNSIVLGWFLLSRKQIFMFFSTVGT